MTPETHHFLQQGQSHLHRGQAMLQIGLNEDAGRAAYLAAFHAAQAVLFERTGRVVKTHRGVQSEFLRLAKDDSNFTPEQRMFLSQAYSLKATADYDTDHESAPSPEETRTALTAAQSFVDAARRALAPTNLT